MRMKVVLHLHTLRLKKRLYRSMNAGAHEAQSLTDLDPSHARCARYTRSSLLHATLLVPKYSSASFLTLKYHYFSVQALHHLFYPPKFLLLSLLLAC